MKRAMAAAEPDFRKACEWWADLPNVWTPVAWTDHLFRFNVLWNGTIFAQPHMNRRTESYAGRGLQLGISPHYTPWHNEWSSAFLRHDDGLVRQGWADDDAPVLWTEWPKDGMVLRSSVFAHIPGGGDVRRGDEPLFAWVRLSIHDMCSALPLEDVYGFNLIIQAPHISATMSMRDNIRFSPENAKYPRALRTDRHSFSRREGLRVLEGGAKVRLGVAPGGDCRGAALHQPGDQQPWPRVHVQLPARRGAYADVLVPMLPAARTVFDAELELGRDAALRETRRHWRRVVATRTRFEVPEPDVNDGIRQSVRFSAMLAERNPATGKYCKINGSWAYANLWTTPGAMDLAMMMDVLGYHRTVARYLEIFREEQGTVVPPGSGYTPHPGYLSTPALYKSIDWLSDNGAVLYTICTHALLSGDREFARRYADCIVKSCEWIRAMRAKRRHGGYEGVLPPAVATDAGTKIQAIWSIGWNYKGLMAAVRVLRQLGHPRAAEFAREAKSYRADFLVAFRDKCRKMATWRDARGRRRAFVPTSLAGEEKAESRHAFFLDTGALFLVFSELMDARDPLMRDIRDWFREGPQRAFYRRDSNCWQVPVLDHEMSSCEPCYSWNVFHSWQMGDRARFLEGMYSLFAGSMSRQTRISCETRGGITGTVFSAPLAIYMARLAVIDDRIREGELHLLRLMPLAWLKPGDVARFERVPTEYGPVSLVTRMSRDGRTLDVRYRAAFRAAPKRVLLHAPPSPGLRTVRVNGQAHRPGAIALA